MKLFKSQYNAFLCGHYSFLIFLTLPGIFINTFLLKNSDGNDMTIPLLYNVLQFSFTAVSMHIAPFFARMFSLRRVAQIGIIMYMLVYSLLIAMSDSVSKYYYIFGILLGLAGGFYWLSYNSIVKLITTNETRDKTIGILGAGYSAVGVVCPFVAGYIISLFGGTKTGYIVVFALAILIAAVTLLFYQNITIDENNDDNKNILKALSQAYKLVLFNKKWRIGMYGEITKGIREGVMQFILALMVYELVKDEFYVGFNSFCSGIAAVIASMLISKVVRPGNRIRSMVISATVLLIAGAVLALRQTAVIVIAFGIISSFAQQFLVTPSTSIMFLLIDKMPGTDRCRSEIFAVREVYLSLGRCIGVLLFVLVPPDVSVMSIVIIFITAIQYLTAYFNNKTEKEVLRAISED